MLSIIVAADLSGGIGYENKLLYNISDDLKRFKELTTGHKIVMGRKTQESLPNGYLPNRENIVLSKSYPLHYRCDGKVYCTKDINSLIENYQDSEEEVFIIGGASIYEQLLPYANKIYLTRIHDNSIADSYFDFNEDEFEVISQVDKETYYGLKYSFIDLIRKK